MKLVILFSLVLMSMSAMAGEVLSCQLSSTRKVKITKVDDRYFYTINGKNKAELAQAMTIQSADVKKEEIIFKIMKGLGIKQSELSRVNFYQLTRNDDGGLSLLRFIAKNNNYMIVSVASGMISVCE
jgi:hypothetical protein